MLNWLMKILASWVLEHVKNGTIELLADEIKRQLDGWIIPKVRAWKDEFFEHLKAQARETGPELDDAIVDFLDVLFDELMPDCTGACNVAMSVLQKPEQSAGGSAIA